MSELLALEDLLILLVAALIPAIFYLAWIRGSEAVERQPWGSLLSAFAWGALFATFVAALIEGLLIGAGTALGEAVPAPEFTFLSPTSPWNLFFVVLVVAPFVEEGLKGLGVVRSLGVLKSVADGPVVGAAVGLGFGFFETFVYGLGAFLVGGLEAGLVLIIVRSFSSVLLHGSTTAMFGYGYARGQVERTTGLTAGYFLLAVGMHASFNLLASLSAFLPLVGLSGFDATELSLVGLFAAILFAFGAIEHVRTVIAQSSFPGASGVHPKFRPPPVRRRAP